jgi:triphosphatase
LRDTLPLPLDDFAKDQISLHIRKAQKQGANYAKLDSAQRHKLRIALKRLRYTLEFFAPLLPDRRLNSYLGALAWLQDELGQVNDHVTAETLISETLTKGSMGMIHGWVAGRQSLLVENLPKALTHWQTQSSPLP